MKKVLKVVIALVMAFSIVGCGESTEKQEAVVNNFFTSLRSADFDGMLACCTEDNTDLGTFSVAINSLKSYQDTATYGQVFVDEADKFVKTVFSELIESYEIDDVKKDDGKYVVTVNAKVKDFNKLQFNMNDYTQMANDYQTKNLNELQKIYLEKGQQAMMEKIYGDIATAIFGDMIEKVKKVEAEDGFFKLTLIESGDTYLISNLE